MQKIRISLLPLHLASAAAFAALTASALSADPTTPPAPAAAAPATPAPKPARQPRTEESAVTPSIKDPNRHAQFLTRIKQGPIDLLFIGDSITDFFPGRGKDTWAKYAPFHPADFGVSGDRTEHVIWRLTNGELDGIHPKVAVVMIGTNNIGHFGDEKPEWAANGVKKIVEIIHQKLPETKVLLLGVFPRGDKGKPDREKVEAINRIISHLDDGKTTRYLDLEKSFLDADGVLPKDIMPDKLHPSAKGYEIWYTAMQPLLEEMMK